MVCLMVVGIQSVNAQRRIVLQHEGSAKFFNPDQAQAALDAAVNGDTIYFDAGEFSSNSGNITISKKVTLIGTGSNGVLEPNTKINDRVTIAMAKGNETLTTTLMEGLIVNNIVEVTKPIKGMKISKCEIWNSLDFSASTESSVIESTYISYLYLSEHINGLTLNNSRFRVVYYAVSSPEYAVFNNCNIIEFQYNSYGGMGTYMNCIIENPTSSLTNDTKFINCLFRNDNYLKGENYNCWKEDNDLLYDDWATNFETIQDNCLTLDEIKEKGYIGTDGTVVGAYGGNNPFTNNTNAPWISEFSAKVNPETLEVTVDMKVTNK